MPLTAEQREETNMDDADEMDHLANLLRRGARAMRENVRLREEVSRLNEKIDEMLTESMRHANEMTGTMLTAILNGVIVAPKASDAAES